MTNEKIVRKNKLLSYPYFLYLIIGIFFVIIFFFISSYKINGDGQFVRRIPPLDKNDYDLRLNLLARVSTSTTATSSTPTASSTKKSLWPVKTVYPNAGAILPFNRVVAYYGNLLSTGMGVLGEFPEDQMLAKLKAEVSKWNLADPETPAIPALHYIAVTAQGRPGDEGKYRLRMPDSEIDKVIKMAEKINALVFLDLQIGQSTIQEELPLL